MKIKTPFLNKLYKNPQKFLFLLSYQNVSILTEI